TPPYSPKRSHNTTVLASNSLRISANWPARTSGAACNSMPAASVAASSASYPASHPAVRAASPARLEISHEVRLCQTHLLTEFVKAHLGHGYFVEHVT